MSDIYTYSHLGPHGRLGNQLWEIASTIGIANASGGEPRFGPWPYQKYFSLPDHYFMDEVPSGRGVVDLSFHDNGEVAYLQETRHFVDLMCEIWELLQPSELSIEMAVDRYPWFWDPDFDSRKCFVHARRGDYLNHPKHFPQMSLAYYERCRDLVLEAVGDVEFVLFSDDPAWCRTILGPGVFDEWTWSVVDGVVTPVEVADRTSEPQDQLDLTLMASCGAGIISNSTFSWWGGFLSSGKICRPDTWFGPALPDIPWERMFDGLTWLEVAV